MADSQHASEYILYQLTCFLYSILNIQEDEEKDVVPEVNISLTLLCAFWAAILVIMLCFCGKNSIPVDTHFGFDNFPEQSPNAAQCRRRGNDNLRFVFCNQDCYNALRGESMNIVAGRSGDNARDNPPNALPDLDERPSTSGLQRLRNAFRVSPFAGNRGGDHELPSTSRQLTICEIPSGEYHNDASGYQGSGSRKESSDKSQRNNRQEAGGDYRHEMRTETHDVGANQPFDDEMPSSSGLQCECSVTTEYRNESCGEYGQESHDKYAQEPLEEDGEQLCDVAENQAVDDEMSSTSGLQCECSVTTEYRNESSGEYHNEPLDEYGEEPIEEDGEKSCDVSENQSVDDEMPSTSGESPATDDNLHYAYAVFPAIDGELPSTSGLQRHGVSFRDSPIIEEDEKCCSESSEVDAHEPIDEGEMPSTSGLQFRSNVSLNESRNGSVYANQPLDDEKPSTSGSFLRESPICDNSQHQYRNESGQRVVYENQTLDDEKPTTSGLCNEPRGVYANQPHDDDIPSTSGLQFQSSDALELPPILNVSWNEFRNGPREIYANETLDDERPSTSRCSGQRDKPRDLSGNKARDVKGNKQRDLANNKQGYKQYDLSVNKPRDLYGSKSSDISGNKLRDLYGNKPRDVTGQKAYNQYGSRPRDELFTSARGPQRHDSLAKELAFYEQLREEHHNRRRNAAAPNKPAADELPTTSGIQNSWHIPCELPARDEPEEKKRNDVNRCDDELASTSGQKNRNEPSDMAANKPLDDELPSTSGLQRQSENSIDQSETKASDVSDTKPLDDELPSTSGLQKVSKESKAENPPVKPMVESRFVIIDDERPSTSGLQRRREVQTCTVNPMPKENNNPLDRSHHNHQSQHPLLHRSLVNSGSPLLEIDALILQPHRRDNRNPGNHQHRNSLIDLLGDGMRLPMPRRPLYLSEWDEVRQIAYRMPRVKKKPPKPLWKW